MVKLSAEHRNICSLLSGLFPVLWTRRTSTLQDGDGPAWNIEIKGKLVGGLTHADL